MHLHLELQKGVLPHLIGLFPGVQFLISTHSPMFVLGMQREFGSVGIDVFNMPDGARIEAESFSQFEVAYQYLQDTERYRQTIAEAIARGNEGKPLVITEGTTDWRHMQAARNSLLSRPNLEKLFACDFEFLEFGPEGDSRCSVCYEMGGDELARLCERYSLIGAGRSLVFIADRDKPDVLKRIGGGDLKAWGNGVYSLALPVPIFREDNPGICIEQMYADEVITSQVEQNGVKRRLFLRSEFSPTGSTADGYYCGNTGVLKSKGSSVVDSSKAIVSRMDDEENHALSKVAFADAVLDGMIELPDDAFDSFIPLFESIQTAIRKEVSCENGELSVL